MWLAELLLLDERGQGWEGKEDSRGTTAIFGVGSQFNLNAINAVDTVEEEDEDEDERNLVDCAQLEDWFEMTSTGELVPSSRIVISPRLDFQI